MFWVLAEAHKRAQETRESHDAFAASGVDLRDKVLVARGEVVIAEGTIVATTYKRTKGWHADFRSIKVAKYVEDPSRDVVVEIKPDITIKLVEKRPYN